MHSINATMSISTQNLSLYLKAVECFFTELFLNHYSAAYIWDKISVLLL